MKLACGTVLAAVASASAVSPVGKVLQLLSDLQTKVIREGEEAQKLFAEYGEWCEDRSRSLGHSIQTATAQVSELKAAIGEHTSSATALAARVEDLAAAVATNEADLKAATEIREKEVADFAKEEAELTDTISTLERAISILQREMSKGGASMLQVKDAKDLARALGALVQASSLSSADAAKLTALVQSGASGEESEDDSALQAPEPAAYKSHSSNIVDTLEGLLDRAEAQLAELRQKEASGRHNFELLQQSLQGEIKVADKDRGEAQKGVAASQEALAQATGDLEATEKDLKADAEAKAELHQACMARSQNFEAETKSRGEELKALAEAKRVIQEQTAGAEAASYSAPALLQVSGGFALASSADLAGLEAVHLLRNLARREGDAAMTQLARRVSAAIRAGGRSGEDPFAKVKGLISDMVARLEKEQAAEATRKDFCDKELSETEAKKTEKDAEVDHLATKIDQLAARSAELKEEVAELQKGLSELAGATAEMESIRTKEHEAFVKTEAELKEGLKAVKTALRILREYYAKASGDHVAAVGSSSGIVGLLEVVESDFAKSLAEGRAVEESAAADFDRESRENDVERSMREKDVEYKTKESTGLDKTLGEVAGDRSGAQAELDAVLEYLAKLKEQCIAKAESYSDRKARREAEVAGLKEALRVLETETALVQRRAAHRKGSLRGRASLAA